MKEAKQASLIQEGTAARIREERATRRLIAANGAAMLISYLPYCTYLGVGSTESGAARGNRR